MIARVPPFVSFLRIVCPLGLGCIVSYSFTNPDSDNVYDVFPVRKSRNCFISAYLVPLEERASFEACWKQLARFYQKQDGYLFNKLVRSSGIGNDGRYMFFDFNQWSSGDSFKIANSRVAQTELLGNLDLSSRNYTRPLMFKMVVDDTNFTPSEVMQARNPESVAARLAKPSRLD